MANLAAISGIIAQSERVAETTGEDGTVYRFRLVDTPSRLPASATTRSEIKALFEDQEGILERIQNSPTDESIVTYVVKDMFPPLVRDDQFADLVKSYFALKWAPAIQDLGRTAEKEKRERKLEEWLTSCRTNHIPAMCRATDQVALTSLFGMRLSNFGRFVGGDLTKIGLVLNATLEAPMFEDFRNVNYRIPIADDNRLNLKKYFHEVADKIDSVSKDGKHTVVYCLMGKSRSATFILAYLIKYQVSSNSLKDAFSRLHPLRTSIKPRLTFLRQLTEFEKECQTLKGLTAEEAEETEWIDYGPDLSYTKVNMPKFLIEHQNFKKTRDYYYEKNKEKVSTEPKATQSTAQ